jgi:hypothetical protein
MSDDMAYTVLFFILWELVDAIEPVIQGEATAEQREKLDEKYRKAVNCVYITHHDRVEEHRLMVAEANS